MSSRFRSAAGFACVSLLLMCSGHVGARDLVVCADPDNLPFSHQDGSGFENRIAELVANDIGARLVYRWQPLRRGVVRKTLGAGLCDMLAGVPVDTAGLATTIAYYRSGYVFVTRASWGEPVLSFDDARMRTGKIGVPLLGADGAAVPPAMALARRAIVGNVTGFPVYGSIPVAQRMVDALVDGRLDVAILWGPQAGYFAHRARIPMAIALATDETSAPKTFSIAIAVREDDHDLRERINAALARSRPEVEGVLANYGVPLLPPGSTMAKER